MSEVQKILLSLSLELIVIAIFTIPSLLLILNGRPEGLFLALPMLLLAPKAANLR